MYLDHEGNRKGDISPSWDQPNTKWNIRLTSDFAAVWGPWRFLTSKIDLFPGYVGPSLDRSYEINLKTKRFSAKNRPSKIWNQWSNSYILLNSFTNECFILQELPRWSCFHKSGFYTFSKRTFFYRTYRINSFYCMSYLNTSRYMS